jgi:CsoR family transcriptional regulator, copper-sensing transcriptional repressor
VDDGPVVLWPRVPHGGMLGSMTNPKSSKEELLARLARVEGQVRGVTRMIEEDRYCIDVLTQIEAAEAALDKIALGLLDDHVRNCMRSGKGASEEQVQELMGAVGRLVNA